MVDIESGLPFTVEGHPSAKSHVAREMLRRLKEDVQYFAKEVGWHYYSDCHTRAKALVGTA